MLWLRDRTGQLENARLFCWNNRSKSRVDQVLTAVATLCRLQKPLVEHIGVPCLCACQPHSTMSSSAAASAYWRVAGMSYLKYSNLCADLVRGALKQELRAKAKEREIVYFKEAVWKDGRPEKQSVSAPAPSARLYAELRSQERADWY